LGLLTVVLRHPIVAVPFGVMSFIFGSLSVLGGAIMMILILLLNAEGQKEMACKTSVPVVAPYALAVNKVMCSEICPCDPGESDENKQEWSSINAQTLKTKFSRVMDEKALSPADSRDYDKYGFNAVLVPFVWKPGGFTKYSDCYEKVLKPNISKYPSLASFI
jgi:hypothetical protein